MEKRMKVPVTKEDIKKCWICGSKLELKKMIDFESRKIEYLNCPIHWIVMERIHSIKSTYWNKWKKLSVVAKREDYIHLHIPNENEYLFTSTEDFCCANCIHKDHCEWKSDLGYVKCSDFYKEN
jgi:hypothetical protein